MTPEILMLSQAIKEMQKIQLVRKEFMNVDECAVYLNVSRSYIYKLTHRKEIPFYKPNRRIYFKREDVDCWLQKACIHANGQ
ncbi:helix-turn-helix domain-containing protein [Aeromonas piscicola]